MYLKRLHSKGIILFWLGLSLLISVESIARISDHLYKELPEDARPADRERPTIGELRRMASMATFYTTPDDTAAIRELDSIVAGLLRSLPKLGKEDQIYVLTSVGEYMRTFRYIGSERGEWVPYAQQLLRLAGNDTAYRRQVCLADNSIATWYFFRQDYEQSIGYCFKALEIAQALKDSGCIESASSSLVMNYAALSLYRPALYYDSLQIAYARDKSNRDFRADNYGYKTGIYLAWYDETKNPSLLDSARNNLQRILIAGGEQTARSRELYRYGMGHYYLARKDYATALIYIDSALSTENFLKEVHNEKLAMKAICLLHTGQAASGKKILDQADVINDPNLAGPIYEALYEHAKATGDMRAALRFYELSIRNRNKSTELTQRGKVLEATEQYRLREKQHEIEKLALLHTVHTKQQKEILLIGSALVLLLCFVIAILYNIGKKKELRALKLRQALETERSNLQLFLQDQDTRISSEREKAVREQRSKISADLHDGLSTTLATLKYYVNDLRLKAHNTAEEQRLKNIEDEVAHAYTQARDYMHYLHSGEDYTTMKLGDFLSRLQQHFDIPGGLQVKPEMDREELNNQLSSAQQTQLYLIIKEAITNALKYAAPKIIHISVHIRNGLCLFHIADNGSGLPDNIQAGLGIKNIRQRVEDLCGRVQIRSMDSGTKVEGSFPV